MKKSLVQSFPNIGLDKNAKINLLKQITKNETFDFTPREFDIIKEYLKAKSAKQIASSFGLSHRTVEHYIEISSLSSIATIAWNFSISCKN